MKSTFLIRAGLIFTGILGIFLIVISCKTTLKTEKPDISNEKLEMPVAESYMNIPIQINLYNLSNDANKEVPQQLFKQDSIDVGSNVKIDLEIKRRGRISITTAKGNINTSIPISVQGKTSFSVKACGICPRISKSQDFNADLTIITSTKLAIDTQWNSERPRAVLGMFDPSARPCVPKDYLSFAVPMKKFVRMIDYMEESFLIKQTWKKVLKKIRSY